MNFGLVDIFLGVIIGQQIRELENGDDNDERCVGVKCLKLFLASHVTLMSSHLQRVKEFNEGM